MNKPKILFNGYSEDWHLSSFKEIGTNFQYGLNAAATSFDGVNKYLRITDIEENLRYFSETQLTSPSADLSQCDSYLLHTGDIVFARTGASVGKSYIYKDKDGKVYFAGFLIRMITKKGFNPNFIFQNTLTSTFAKHVRLVSQRSGQPGLNVNDLQSYRFFIPSTIEEQNKIGEYLCSLDSLLKGCISKISCLKQIKSACLQSMFPKEGDFVPKVRFKGFEDRWTIRKLSDCLTVSHDKNTHNLYTALDVLSVSDDYGVKNQIELLGRSYAGKSVSNYGILHKEEIVFTKSPLKSKPFGIIKMNTYKTGIVSVLYAIYKTNKNISPLFIHYYFDPAWRLNRYLSPLVNKGAKNTMNISDEYALSGEVMVPSFEEQLKIAAFFENLDKQISLQTQRLEKLKHIKSACLDKMFV